MRDLLLCAAAQRQATDPDPAGAQDREARNLHARRLVPNGARIGTPIHSEAAMHLTIPPPELWLHHAYWDWRRAQHAKGLCFCGTALDRERIREKRLCAACEQADRERIAKLGG
jgi:hypothetical protein